MNECRISREYRVEMNPCVLGAAGQEECKAFQVCFAEVTDSASRTFESAKGPFNVPVREVVRADAAIGCGRRLPRGIEREQQNERCQDCDC